MKIITFEDIKNLNISPKLCFEWVNDMILHKNDTILPAKISMKPIDGVFCNVMPCMLGNDGKYYSSGVKIVNRYPDRVPSLNSKLILLDAENGNFLALMDANWITAMRTGAVAAHSIILLAKSDFLEIGILGLGNTARATLLILSAMLPNKKLNIKLLKHKEQEVLFTERFKNYTNLKFTYAENEEDLVKGSEVIISAVTYLPKNICEDKYFEEGVLVVPIHTLGFTNCDLFFDKIYADDYNHVHHFKNFEKFKQFAEVSDVVNGKAEGRTNDKERILVYNIGVSIHDINFAQHIYELIRDNTNLLEINMKDPKEKFWI